MRCCPNLGWCCTHSQVQVCPHMSASLYTTRLPLQTLSKAGWLYDATIPESWCGGKALCQAHIQHARKHAVLSECFPSHTESICGHAGTPTRPPPPLRMRSSGPTPWTPASPRYVTLVGSSVHGALYLQAVRRWLSVQAASPARWSCHHWLTLSHCCSGLRLLGADHRQVQP